MATQRDQAPERSSSRSASPRPARTPARRPLWGHAEADPADRDFSPLSRLPAWVRHVILVLLVIGPSFAPTDVSGTITSSPAAALLVLVSVGGVLLRRRAPLLGASASVAACVVGVAVAGPVVTYLLATLIGVFAVARRRPRRVSLIFSAATVLLLAAATLLFLD